MKKTFRFILTSTLIAALGGFAGVSIYKLTEGEPETARGGYISDRQHLHLTGLPDMVPAPVDFVGAAEKTVAAVVYVKTTYAARTNSFYNPFRDFFYNHPRQQPQRQSTGSGVIISDDGYIVTNNHVVENASSVEVTLNDKRTFGARIVGADPSTDLALLKIDEQELPFIPYGNSDEVRIGEWVLAVGNPFNLTSTVTAGIVSAKARNIRILNNQEFPLESFIQTDAAVNRGNSGGALVSTNGELVGINSAIASTTGTYAGYSFAIPVNLVRKVMDDLVEYGSVQRAFIGVQIRDINQELADDKGLNTLEGVYVSSLTDGGAAADAGIEDGDVITHVEGIPVKTSSELQEQVGRYRPGDDITVTLLRGREVKNKNVTLRNNNGTTRLIKKDEVFNLLGAEFAELDEASMDRLGLDNGIKVVDLKPGKLLNAGIKKGFVITRIDNENINSITELKRKLSAKHSDGVLIEGVYPNGMRAYYGFGM